MNISKNNYEQFFIDYFDGRLSKQAEGELMRFLEQHPELKAEFDAFDPALIIEPDASVIFPGKAGLKKKAEDQNHPLFNTITSDNYKWWFISYAEGDLSDNERRKTERFVKSYPSYAREFEIYKALKLKPENTIHYPNKDSLKQKSKKRSRWLPGYFPYATAAAIAILFGILQLTKQKQPERQIDTITKMVERKADNITQKQQPLSMETQKTMPVKEITGVASKADNKPIQHDAINPLDEIKSEQLAITHDATLNINKRFDLTSEYYYQTVQEDLEYLVAYKEYQQKNFFGKLAHRVGHRVAPGNDNFIIDQDFSWVNILTRGVHELNELASTQHIKSDIFELKHKRTRKNITGDAIE
mgnify:CR=1 FL=1